MQVEWHPHYYDPELKSFCRREGILLQAYSSLGGSNNHRLISDPTVVGIAKKLNRIPAQVFISFYHFIFLLIYHTGLTSLGFATKYRHHSKSQIQGTHRKQY